MGMYKTTPRHPRFCLSIIMALLTFFGQAGGQVSLAAGNAVQVTEVTDFDQPWAMTFLPDGRLLVTEKPGALWLTGQDGSTEEVTGLPAVAYGGQGGLGDVVLHPDFETNQLVYLSYAEAGNKVKGAAVARARLELTDTGASLRAFEEIGRAHV